MSSDVLFRPFKLKGLNLPNRVVMAPMTRSFSPGGVPTEDVAQYYRRRAEGDCVGQFLAAQEHQPADNSDYVAAERRNQQRGGRQVHTNLSEG